MIYEVIILTEPNGLTCLLSMTEEDKKIITREKLSGRVAHEYKLAALMKRRKEEILHNKEQSPVQPTEQSSVRLLYSLQYS